ncbi:hypothetical protein EAL2_808p03410 (plasmid) [Peptoclostridium acidaminophilum DSM 3953]|uniref:Uncharacterized protein n=1 Tax=Peptoclostridium acidaminophilum DSM 3953 TaxID=1286171 RepID=W8UAL9_PEPAC|nr:hypothetical protein EAL2_808p03410 [Peptoclostridium acidaminophilum DSM 3953]
MDLDIKQVYFPKFYINIFAPLSFPYTARITSILKSIAVLLAPEPA